MATVDFTLNKKVYLVTKLLLYYGRELRMSFEMRKKVKVENFVNKMKEIHEKAKAMLKKSQDKIKRYINRNRKKKVKYKMEN